MIETQNVEISDSVFNNGNDYGLFIKSSDDFVISNSRFQENAKDGIGLANDGTSCENFIISDNIITGNSWDGINVRSLSGSTHDNFIITNNDLTGNNEQGLDDNSAATNKITNKNLE